MKIQVPKRRTLQLLEDRGEQRGECHSLLRNFGRSIHFINYQPSEDKRVISNRGGWGIPQEIIC